MQAISIAEFKLSSSIPPLYRKLSYSLRKITLRINTVKVIMLVIFKVFIFFLLVLEDKTFFIGKSIAI
ncbi:hypothetical protein SDC9_168132 [bioreactor metagenome]|uniref:Uncharacterized protein n=1 Tax=bioreactor metagenome TaxID=1076179 RepID=A0A645GA38_9ZZZZ